MLTKKRSKINCIPAVMWVMTGVFALYSLGLLFPLLFALNSSVKDGDVDFIMNMTKLTVRPNFKNYLGAWTEFRVVCGGHYAVYDIFIDVPCLRRG